MLKENFMVGPFEISPGRPYTYDIYYGPRLLAHNIDADGETRQAVIESLGDCLARLRGELRDRSEVYYIDLVTGDGEKTGAGFWCEALAVPGMQGAIPDDRFPYWLRSQDRVWAMPVSLAEFSAIAERHRAPPLTWIANLLPDAVLTDDPEQWRAPTAFELRHVVGEGSFTGISGAKAAALVGISPQNFRKYLAAYTAKNRQSISFSAWHLLLQRLGVIRPLAATFV